MLRPMSNTSLKGMGKRAPLASEKINPCNPAKSLKGVKTAMGASYKKLAWTRQKLAWASRRRRVGLAPAWSRGARGPAAVRTAGFLSSLAAVVLLAAVSPATADSLEPFANAAGEPIAGYLARPAGAGPFPAVVLLHSCLGLPSNRKAIEDRARQRGLRRAVRRRVLHPRPQGDLQRRLPGSSPLTPSGRWRSLRVSPAWTRTASPLSASRRAQTERWPRPRLRPARRMAFRGASRSGRRRPSIRPAPTRQDSASRSRPSSSSARADYVTPAADCRRLAEGQPDVRLIVLPGAGHCFDDPAFAGGKRVLGMTLTYDAAAARRGMAELIAFLSMTVSVNESAPQAPDFTLAPQNWPKRGHEPSEKDQ